jgi:hypothetical protein
MTDPLSALFKASDPTVFIPASSNDLAALRRNRRIRLVG